LGPGDVVLLTPGRYVPADCRLLETERLSLDESALTGESMPVEKDAGFVGNERLALGDRRNMVYMGATVTGGSGTAMVVGTGANSEIGRIQSLTESARPPPTLVERQLDELGGQLVWMSSAICGLVFIAGLLRGHGWLEMLKSSISLAVAAVPEGLPTVATTTLAIGIRHMRERQVLVRRLGAIETLGSVQVFCMDKTGTLTLNRMSVVEMHVGLLEVTVDGERFILAERPIEPLDLPECRLLFTVVTLCSEAGLKASDSGLRIEGSATEKALVELAVRGGLDPRTIRADHPPLNIWHRAEDRPFMATLHRTPTGRFLAAVKGSPERLLEMCRWYMREGRLQVLGDYERHALLRENERMAGQGLRVLGVAYGIAESNEEPLENLVWLGLTGMADPLRPGMVPLLARFHQAGIDTVIITGDQSATAYAIAKQLDLADGRPVEILDSVSLDKVDPELLSGVIRQVQVFSRVSPAHKLQIVKAMQQAGEIVAMTGDGINDGPALKAADLGVAMGGSGTDVARSVADIVLEDDNLDTMVVAIRDGRTIYNNIRKSIRYLLATNLSEIEVMLACIGLGLGQPLSPMQLLWINLVTDIFPSLALAMEAPEPDILERPPRDPKEPVLTGRDLRRLVMESTVITGSTLASYLYGRLRYGPGMKANTLAFMPLTVAQFLHALSSRSEEHSLFDRDRPLPPNRHLDRALGISMVAQTLTVLVPGLRKIMGTAPLSVGDLLVVGAAALAPLLINELNKKSAITPPQPHEVTRGVSGYKGGNAL
jgi:Ca2+-transporting ATPase